MAVTIEQITAVSYPHVVAERRRPENQWVENAALKFMEKKGVIRRVDFGENIEIPVDYRPNSDGGVMSSDMDSSNGLKTDVITSVVFDIAQLSKWVTWSKGDDARNPSVNQKVDLVKSLLDNGINAHDDLIEQHIFTTSTAGGVEILGLDSLVPDSGQGNVGGIDASAELWWRNFADTYTDENDIEATMTDAHNTALKGSGSALGPKMLISGAEAHALYESCLTPQIRYTQTNSADGAFITLKFKDSDYIFSQYGDDHIYFLNPKSYQIQVSKQYFRDKGSTEVITGQNAFQFPIYSVLQNIVTNKSRLAVISQS